MLRNVYLAVGGEQVFALHAASPDAECYVGYGIRAVLGRAYRDAEEAVRCSLERTTIADVLRDTLAEFPGEVQVAGSAATVPGVG